MHFDYVIIIEIADIANSNYWYRQF